MSIFDWYNPNSQQGTFAGIKSNIGQAANFAADAGGWISNLFNRWRNPTSYNPGELSSTPAPQRQSLIAQGPAAMRQYGPSLPSISAPQQTVNPSVPTENPQVTNTQPTYSQTQTSFALPAVGSPEYLAAQRNGTIFDQNGIVTPIPTSASSRNFTINPGTTINSSSLNGSNTLQDALNIASQNRLALFNGTGTLSNVPSDSLYANILGQQYNASLYSPQQISALQNYNDTQSQIIQQQLAERRAIMDRFDQSGGTVGARNEALAQMQRRYDAQLADLAAAQSGNTLSLQTLAMLQQNRVGALNTLASAFAPQSVSPGNTLVNPVTGQVQFQGMGASPQTILSTAMQLWQTAQSAGTATYNSDGSPNLSPFIGQAQQFYGGGFGMQNMNGMSGGQTTSNFSPQNGGIPPQLSTYLQASGGQIVNEDKVPTNQRDTIKMLAAQNGIPYLTGADLDKYQSISVTQENLKNMDQVAQRILSSGIGGRTIGALWNTISGSLQLNPDISSFKAWRDTALNTIQALAGGSGSGFRLNQSEIEVATNNLPTITDNIETAQAKMSIVNDMLNRWRSQILTGNPTALSGNRNQSNNSLWNW